MKLEINSDRFIRDVQQDFNLAFPYLKIEFFANGMARSSSGPKRKIAAGLKINEASRQISNGVVALSDNMTVSELEQKLRQDFGLAVQVFRKSGNIWLETTMTDNWTLRQQNEHGKEISTVPQRKSGVADFKRED